MTQILLPPEFLVPGAVARGELLAGHSCIMRVFSAHGAGIRPQVGGTAVVSLTAHATDGQLLFSKAWVKREGCLPKVPELDFVKWTEVISNPAGVECEESPPQPPEPGEYRLGGNPYRLEHRDDGSFRFVSEPRPCLMGRQRLEALYFPEVSDLLSWWQKAPPVKA